MFTPRAGFLVKVLCVLFISSASSPYPLQSQCSTFVLTTQVAVDQFHTQFGCTVLDGQLMINGADIQNLNGLSHLTQVRWLTIANTSLVNLSGLESLTVIEGGLDLQDNPELTSLNGLQNLTSVGYIDLRIAPKLTDISQFANITGTGSPLLQDGNLIIRECPLLQTLQGLQNISHVDGYLWIEHNPSLQHLLHLHNLQSVSKTCWINDNDALTDLSGLESLGQVNRLGVVEHASLVNLSGLYGLEEIPGGLVIQNNQAVVSLSGLENIRFVGTEFRIQTMPLVSLQALQNLQSVGGDPEATGFQGLLLDNLPQLPNLLGLENLVSIGADFTLDDLDMLQNLSPINRLKTVGRDLRIKFNNELSSLDGLDGLVNIGQDLTITNNPKLSSCAIEGICQYLKNPPGLFDVFNNASTPAGCNSSDQVLARCSPLNELRLVDANAEFLNKFMEENSSIRTAVYSIPGNDTALENARLSLDISPEFISKYYRVEPSPENQRLTSGEDCPVGLCPEVLTNYQPIMDTYHVTAGCWYDVIVPAGTVHTLDRIQHFNFPSIGDNYCVCNYIAEVQLPGPCIIGVDTTTSYNFKMRGVEMHFHLLEDPHCPRQDTLDAKAGGPYEDPSYPGEWYLGHEEIVAKAQSYYFYELGPDQMLDQVMPRFELVRDRTSPRGCFPVESKLIDGNIHISGGSPGAQDIRDLNPGELVQLNASRDAVAADGVSTMLMRMEFQERGRISLINGQGSFELPWGDTTYLIGGIHYGFMLYTPPDVFIPQGETYLFSNEVEAFDNTIGFTFTGQGDSRTVSRKITLVRPPVVLVHGTYSDPVKAWKTPIDGGTSFYDRLTNEGYKVFAVNYEPSNGTTGVTTDNSSFQENAEVIWGDVYPENRGGIKDAMNYYRDSLKVAATQADVIGHSLGGILGRVYASPHYNPDYKRPQNFMEGDINRLVTLASTHFGSHLGELQTFLNGLSPFDIGALDWVGLQAANFISSWVGGATPGKAILDQLPEPMGEALELIGRTEIPSHAITCSVPRGGLKDMTHDPAEEYYDLFWYITLLMYQSDDVRNAYLNSKLDLIEMGLQASTTLEGGNPAELFPGYNNLLLYKTMIEDALHRSGQVLAVMDGAFELPSEVDLFRYAIGEVGMGDFADPLLDVFVAGADPVGVAAEYLLPDPQFPTAESILENYLNVHEESMEGLRALIFNNDDNDGVVRVQSQSGELEKECPQCVTHFESVLHGFAPRYSSVQQRVVDLLDGGMSFFNATGFPPSDHAQMIYYPPESLDLFEVKVEGGEAICQSGLVPEHARAFARIADEQDVIILTRPVNPDGTPLIRGGAATKAMDVKPKSSNWGPQKGYLPVKQRYSKLWKVFEGEERKNKIAEYDAKAQENLANGVTISRQLMVEACNDMFNVYLDLNKITLPEESDLNAEDEVVLVPLIDTTKVCYWYPDFLPDAEVRNCEPRNQQHVLVPFEVMASPDAFEEDGITGRFLTADYDLLMIGFFENEELGAPMPPDVPFRPGVGQMTSQQEALMGLLNDAVEETGYSGGKVIHHGPENQFSKSPYIDYPVTVFAPDDIPNGFFSGPTDGLVLSIQMGPPGFRDIYLKRFVNKMRRAGYDLYDNPDAPGWKWTWNSTGELYELEDSPDLGDYVEQLPKNSCPDHPAQRKVPCDPPVFVEDMDNEKPASWLHGARGTGLNPDNRLTPNPVFGQNLQFTVDAEYEISFSWYVLDAFGQIRNFGRVNSEGSTTSVLIDVSRLEPGMYSVITDVYGHIGRFVRM